MQRHKYTLACSTPAEMCEPLFVQKLEVIHSMVKPA